MEGAEKKEAGIVADIDSFMNISETKDMMQRLDPLLSFLSQVDTGAIYDLLNRLEMYREVSVEAHNSIKEIMARLIMLKLSSNINIYEIEEFLHVNLSMAEVLGYDNIVKLISKIEDLEVKQGLSNALESIEKTVVRIASKVGTNNAQPEQIIKGNILIKNVPEIKPVDQDLLKKIAGYKNDMTGHPHLVETKRTIESSASTTNIIDGIDGSFMEFELNKRLWYIGNEMLRRIGLTHSKIVSLLPMEEELAEPAALKGRYSDNYIESEAGLRQLAQKIHDRIIAKEKDIFEPVIDILMGQIGICSINKMVFSIIERNCDFMPSNDEKDRQNLNITNIKFNELMKEKGNTDEWLNITIMALRTIGRASKKQSRFKKALLKLTGARFSLPSEAIVTPRTKAG